jgi:thymidine phosphorylase
VTLALAYEIHSLFSDEAKEVFINRCDKIFRSGKAYERFKKMIIDAGGDSEALEEIEEGRFIEKMIQIRSKQDGRILEMDTFSMGKALIYLGGGRLKKGDSINHHVGMELHVKRGDSVRVGDPLLTLFYADEAKKASVMSLLEKSIMIGEREYEENPLIYRSVH